MGENKYLKFYSRKEVQQVILEVASDRELAARYNEAFGRRPDTVHFPGDVLDMAKKGATSFHISEERWKEPMDLKPGMTKRELDGNRKGWDLILDIDTPYWDYARWCTYFLLEAIKFHNVESISVKFSGSKGFHIGIPFEAFPDEVNGMKTKSLFPDAPKVITLYLENMICELLSKKILSKDGMGNIAKMTGKKRSDLVKDGKFNPFALVDIDTILISSRHMFRSPYSMHEKTKLVSLPIAVSDMLKFKKKDAKIENVEVGRKFLDRNVKKHDAKQLIIQAYDWHTRKFKKTEKKEVGVYELPKKAIGEEFFPACIANILKGGMEDGKKRALFILVNFLRSVGWDIKTIEAKLKEWNKKNKEPLREVYINAQISWHKKQKGTVLPPNCANEGYYKDLRICCDGICKKFKNPVNYTKKQSRMKKKKVVVKKKSKS
tara:strand:+ start:2009 stop:3310 length:1302 start_codon:yes stop_codon:yes gene_type:complete